MKDVKFNLFKQAKFDIPASIVVFLVALPLCLAIAVASGADPFAGIISGVIGGIVVGFFSGSSLGVSGPAAGLASIVATSIDDLGGKEAAFDIFILAVALSGVFQIILGFFKAGVIGYYFPSSVIKGMLAGIGITIFIKQFEHAFGHDENPIISMGFIEMDEHNMFSNAVNALLNPTLGPVIVTAISLFILIIWQQKFIQKQKFSKIIQAPLLVVVLAMMLKVVFDSIPSLTISEEHIVSIPSIESAGGFTNLFTLPRFSEILNPKVLTTAALITVVGSLETLLSVEATDKLDPQKRITPTNQELIAQGIGNTVSGLIGGLPITQVIVRSTANVTSGGKTKASAIFHGILLAACVLAIPNVLNMIPMACLAAILFLVGFKLTNPKVYKSMYKQGPTQFVPFIITVIAITFTNLLVGIGIGLAIAFIHILWNNFKTPYFTDLDKADNGKPVTMILSEHVTFLNKASILHTLEELPEGILFIIDANRCQSIHPDVMEAFTDFLENAKTRNIRVETTGFDKWTEDHKNLTTEKN